MKKLATLLLIVCAVSLTTSCDGWSARMDAKNAMMQKKKKRLDSLRRVESQQWIEQHRQDTESETQQLADTVSQDSTQ